jgi:1-acyl-sn-glycerol-3-phosphate acyltransferase
MPPLALAAVRAPEAAQIDAITRLCADDLMRAFKLERLGPFRPAAEWVCRIPSRRFAYQLAHFDALVASQGLGAGGRYILDLFARRSDMRGIEQIPSTGPLVIVSNHPGMADAMIQWAGLANRPDLKIIAAERELLQTLPHVERHLLYVSPKTGGRTGLIRSAVAHLRAGGALLTFPAGHIEPDPTVAAGAITSLADWSPSLTLFARNVPETLIIPTAVGGVISASAQQVPVLKLFQSQRERDWAAATLQVLLPRFRDVYTRLLVGQPIPASRLTNLDPQQAIRVVTAEVAPLLATLEHEGVLGEVQRT